MNNFLINGEKKDTDRVESSATPGDPSNYWYTIEATVAWGQIYHRRKDHRIRKDYWIVLFLVASKETVKATIEKNYLHLFF